MAFLSKGKQTQREEDVGGKTVTRYTPFFAILVFLPVFLMVVWGIPRSDTYLYLSMFQRLPTGLIEGCRAAITSKGPAFTMIGVFVKSIFRANNTIYRFLIALIHTVPTLTIFRRYSDDYIFTIYVFLAQGMHLAWMMNGLRQYIAVVIIFAATPWIIEKKYTRVIALILLAAAFHKSALFMLFVIFVVNGKTWNRRTLIFIVLTILAALLFSRNISIFDSIAEHMGYSVDALREYGDYGVNPIRVLVSSVPLVLAFISRETLKEQDDKLINICVNMSVITTGVMLLAAVTSGITVGRMGIYTSLYNLILLPHVIESYFTENNIKVVKITAVILYFIYFCIERGF